MRTTYLALLVVSLAAAACAPAARPAPAAAPSPPLAPSSEPAAAPREEIVWSQHGRCKSAVLGAGDDRVLVVASEEDGYALGLPPHAMVKVSCGEATPAPNGAAEVLRVVYPTADTFLVLTSMPTAIVADERATLDRIARATVAELRKTKATGLAHRIDGIPGAMLATITGKVPSPSGTKADLVMWTTERQRPSDKRLFSITVATSSPTAETSRMWSGVLTDPQNPTLDPRPAAPPASKPASPPAGEPASLPATTLM